MKNKILIILLLLLGNAGYAQTGIDAVLQSVATNNKVLQSAQYLNESQKLEARTGIYLENPDVDFDYMFANKAAEKNESELKVVQSFDFPTAYVHKSKIAKLQGSQADAQYRITRQDILLQAKQTCIELIFLNKEKDLIAKRLKNAEGLNQSYQSRLKAGDANVLEVNKIRIELLNVQTESKLNYNKIQNALQTLAELNGGQPINFTDTTYMTDNNLPEFEKLRLEAESVNPTFAVLDQEKQVAERQVKLARSMSLPKLSVGYRSNIINPEQFHGIHGGISIPLWENKNTVKKAKAQSAYTQTQLESEKVAFSSQLQQLYNQCLVLRQSMNEYQELLAIQNNTSLLDKALKGGELSIIEYFTETNQWYDSITNYLQLQRDYYDTLAQLLKYQL